ncbi:alkaline phosphatase family protein [Clostridium sardiniense]
MINEKSIRKVKKSSYKDFIVPLYDTYCFSNIPDTIKNLLGIQNKNGLPIDTLGGKRVQSNKVIFLLIDAFGWSFYEKYKNDSRFMKKIEKKGVVSKITSQFPSTTTAHVTTALTGLPVYKHGLYEWFYYEKEVDDIITAFLFKEARVNEYESLKNKNIDPKSFLPSDNIFKELNGNGVKSRVYQPSYINNSIYTNTMCNCAEIIGYEKYDDLFNRVYNDLKENYDKEYYYIYLPEIDSVAHEFGCNSEEFDLKVKEFLKNLDRFFENIEKDIEDISILISADHGQIETDLNKKNYLNEIIPEIEMYLKRNEKGELLSPTGYCRDLFLMVEDEYILKVKEMIEEKLKDVVEIFTYEDLFDIGLFKEDSKRLNDRCPNLLLIPKENNNIWWYEEGVFDISLKGVHGGISKEEMEIPFLYYRKGEKSE